MKFGLRVAFLLAVTCPFLCRAKLIIFGDSLSDNGLDGVLPATELVNNRFSTGPINVGVYPPAPYYQGRFTNGFIWVDVAARLLGQEVDNYATGGSNGFAGEVTVAPPFAYVTSPTRVPVRSLVQQAEAYAALNAGATATATDKVIIFTGADEYYQKARLGTGPITSDDVISAINETLTTAYEAGARDFVLVDLPDLTAFPFAAGSDTNALSSLTSSHNSGLASTASTFKDKSPDASVTLYNVSTLFRDVLAGNSPVGVGPTPITNTTGPARGAPNDVDAAQAAGFSLPSSPNADAYVFWDAVHPTKHFHQIIGQDFANKVNTTISAAVAAPAPAAST